MAESSIEEALVAFMAEQDDKSGIVMNWVLVAECMDPETGKVSYFETRSKGVTPATAIGLYSFGADSEEWDPIEDA